MDLSLLLSSLLGDDTLQQVCRGSGASESEVRGVLDAVLPALLGGESPEDAAQAASKKTGLDLEKILAIVAVALPLLKKLLGNGGSSGGGLGSLLTGLLGGDDGASASAASSGGGIGSLLMGLLGDDGQTAASGASAKPTVIQNPNKKKKTSTAAKKPAAKKTTTTAAKKTTTAAKKTTTTAAKKTAPWASRSWKAGSSTPTSAF